MPTATLQNTETAELIEQKKKVEDAIQIVNQGIQASSKEEVQKAIGTLMEEMDKGGDLFREILSGEIRITRGEIKDLINIQSVASKEIASTEEGQAILTYIHNELFNLLSIVEEKIEEAARPVMQSAMTLKNNPVIKAFGRTMGVAQLLKDRFGGEWTVKKKDITAARVAVFGSDMRSYGDIANWMNTNDKAIQDLENELLEEIKKSASLKSAPSDKPKLTTIDEVLQLINQLNEFEELKTVMAEFASLEPEQKKAVREIARKKGVVKLLRGNRDERAILPAIAGDIDGKNKDEIRAKLKEITGVIRSAIDETSGPLPSAPPKTDSRPPQKKRRGSSRPPGDMDAVDRQLEKLRQFQKGVSSRPAKRRSSKPSAAGGQSPLKQPDNATAIEPVNLDTRTAQLVEMKKGFSAMYKKEIERIRGWISDGAASGEGSSDYKGWSKTNLIALLDRLGESTGGTPDVQSGAAKTPITQPDSTSADAPSSVPATPTQPAPAPAETIEQKREKIVTTLAQRLGEMDKDGDQYKGFIAQLRQWVADGAVSGEGNENLTILTTDDLKEILKKLGEPHEMTESTEEKGKRIQQLIGDYKRMSKDDPNYKEEIKALNQSAQSGFASGKHADKYKGCTGKDFKRILEELGESYEVPNEDEYISAVKFIMNGGILSISKLQRQFRIGYNKAYKILERMESEGIVSPPDAKNKRTLLRTDFEEWERNKGISTSKPPIPDEPLASGKSPEELIKEGIESVISRLSKMDKNSDNYKLIVSILNQIKKDDVVFLGEIGKESLTLLKRGQFEEWLKNHKIADTGVTEIRMIDKRVAKEILDGLGEPHEIKKKTKAELATVRLAELDEMAKSDHDLMAALMVLRGIEEFRGQTALNILMKFGTREEADNLVQWFTENNKRPLAEYVSYMDEGTDIKTIVRNVKGLYFSLNKFDLRIPLLKHFKVPRKPRSAPTPLPAPDTGPKTPDKLPDTIKPDNLRRLVETVCGDDQDKRAKFVTLWAIYEGKKEIDDEDKNNEIVGVLTRAVDRAEKTDANFSRGGKMTAKKIGEILEIDVSSTHDKAPDVTDIQDEHTNIEGLLIRITYGKSNTGLQGKIQKLFKIIRLDPDDIDKDDKDQFAECQEEFKRFKEEDLAKIFDVSAVNEDELIDKITKLGRRERKDKLTKLNKFIDETFSDDFETFGDLIKEKNKKDKKDDGGDGGNGAPDSGADKDTSGPEISEKEVGAMMESLFSKREMNSKSDPAVLAIMELVRNDETIREHGITALTTYLKNPKHHVNLAVREKYRDMDHNELLQLYNEKMAKAEAEKGPARIVLLKEADEIQLARALKINNKVFIKNLIEDTEAQLTKIKRKITMADTLAKRAARTGGDDIHEQMYAQLLDEESLLEDKLAKFKAMLALKNGKMEYGSTSQLLSMIQVFIADKNGSEDSILDVAQNTEKLIQAQRSKALGKLKSIGSWGLEGLYNIASFGTMLKPRLKTMLTMLAKDPKFNKIKKEDWETLAKAHNNFGAVETWVEGLDGGMNKHNMEKVIPRLITYLEMSLQDGHMRYLRVGSVHKVKSLLIHMKAIRHKYIENLVAERLKGKENIDSVDKMTIYFEELNKATVAKNDISKNILRWRAAETIGLSAAGAGAVVGAGVAGSALAAAGLATKLGVIGGGASLSSAYLSRKFKNEKVKHAFRSAALRGLATTGLAVGAAALNPMLLPAALGGIFVPNAVKLLSTKEGLKKAARGAGKTIGAGATVVGATVKTGWWGVKAAAKVGVVTALVGVPLLLPATWRWLGRSVPSWIRQPISQLAGRIKAPKMEMPEMGGAMPAAA